MDISKYKKEHFVYRKYSIAKNLIGKGVGEKKDEELETDYFTTHNLHFGYMHTGLFDFIELCLVFNEYESKTAIDIILPINYVETKEDASNFFKSLSRSAGFNGIKEIVFLKKETEGNDFVSFQSEQFQKDGKTLRIINPFPLSNDDMQSLMSLSSGCVGCTGDLSLSEVLSSEKLPFYQITSAKKLFFKSLLALAKEFFPSADSSFVRYLNYVKNHNTEKLGDIGKLLQDNQLHEERALFYEFLRKNYNFDEILIDIVTEKIAEKEFSELRQMKNKLYSSFEKGKKTLAECYEEYQSFISTFGLAQEGTG